MSDTISEKSTSILFTKPELKDGLDIHALIQRCPPLDLNSSYCYMLASSLWADTSICAWQNDQLIGFISALMRPDHDNTLFIWQVAVAPQARGQKLARRMLVELLKRSDIHQANYLHTTISPDNQASWSTFQGLARQLDCPSQTLPFLDKDLHFKGAHDSEELFEIGPFDLSLSCDANPLCRHPGSYEQAFSGEQSIPCRLMDRCNRTNTFAYP